MGLATTACGYGLSQAIDFACPTRFVTARNTLPRSAVPASAMTTAGKAKRAGKRSR